jgi:multiple sugar transport system permease protein
MTVGSLLEMRSPTIGNPFNWLFGEKMSMGNFGYILASGQFIKWVGNSLIIPVITNMFFSAILGYIFARKVFPFREFIFWVMMGVVMLPNQLLIIPRYIMFSEFGWINTYLPLIVPDMMTLPKDLEEAAHIDGANDFTVFFRIYLPLAKPVIATVGTFSFIQIGTIY